MPLLPLEGQKLGSPVIKGIATTSAPDILDVPKVGRIKTDSSNRYNGRDEYSPKLVSETPIHIELYYNNRRLHSALKYRTPCQYKTEFERVIDSKIDVAQGVDVATEDRALRGRTSSADVALQTAGVTASGRHSKPGRSCRSKPKAKNPRGFGGQSHPIPSTMH